MKTRKLMAAVALLIAVAVIAGCTSSAAKPSGSPSASTSSTSTGTPSTSTSSTGTTDTSRPPSTTSSPTDPATREAQDRQAVQAAWTKFWRVYETLYQIPPAQLPATVGSVAVDVTRTQLLNEVKVFTAGHKTGYGYVINHPYWQQPIGAKSTAVMGDCMDQSHFGSKSTTTGQKLTVGVARDNTKATFVKGADGVWRVQLIEYLLDVKC